MEVDVLVIGGGPAGSAAAIYLQGAGHSVVLLEAGRFERFRVGETLAPAIADTLERAALGASLQCTPARPAFSFGSCWGGEELLFASHMSRPQGQGWHVDRRAFDQTLFTMARERGVETWTDSRIGKITPDPNASGWQVSWRSRGGTQTARCRFLLNASGRQNGISARMGDDLHVVDDLVAVMRVIEGHDLAPAVGMIEAVEHGWWYLAPLPGGRCVAMLMTDLDLAQALEAKTPAQWQRLLDQTRHARRRLPPAQADTKIEIRLARSHCLNALHAHNYLPIGDALASFDPINGAGVMRAIDTALGGARTAQAALAGHGSAATQFLQQVQTLYQTYLTEKRRHYRAETRWADAPFWQRRR